MYELPDEDAVVDVVRQARAEKARIRPIGTLHSWSRVAEPEQRAIRLGDRGVRVDGTRAVMSGGTTLGTLNQALVQHGLGMPILGSICDQRVAGAVATGTHGSSLQWGNLSTLVRRVRLVAGDGEVRDLVPSDPAFGAAAMSLGLLGVVTELELEVGPAFVLREWAEVLPLAQAIADLSRIGRSAEYVKVWWLPHTDRAQIIRYERTDRAETWSERAHAVDTWTNRWLFPMILGLGSTFPSMVPAMNQVVASAYLGPRERVGRSDRMLCLPMPPVHRETEASVALEHGSEAWDRVAMRIARDEVPVDFVFEVRFVRGDDLWISPDAGRDSVRLGGYTASMANTRAMERIFAEELATYAPRPHWGKAFQPEWARAAYPRLPELMALSRSWDPDGVFRSELSDALEGRSEAAKSAAAWGG